MNKFLTIIYKNDKIKIWCTFQASTVFGLQQNKKIVPCKIKRISNIVNILTSKARKNVI